MSRGERFERDMEFSRLCEPHVIAFLARAFFRRATLTEDTKQATDLVFDTDRGRVETCIRRFSVLADYPPRAKGEFAIRCRLSSGLPTKLDKFLAGHGDWMVYGYADDNTGILRIAGLGDLAVFRSWYRAVEALGCERPGVGQIRKTEANGGWNEFRLFKWIATRPQDGPPREFIRLASWWEKCEACTRLRAGAERPQAVCASHYGYPASLLAGVAA